MKKLIFTSLLIVFSNLISSAQESRELVVDNPDVVIDLKTQKGVDILKTSWKYSDANIIDDQFGAPGPTEDDPLLLYPTGPKKPTWNINPKAGSKDFDDTNWKQLDPTSLEERRCPGRLCFNWYRLNITIPSLIDGVFY